MGQCDADFHKNFGWNFNGAKKFPSPIPLSAAPSVRHTRHLRPKRRTTLPSFPDSGYRSRLKAGHLGRYFIPSPWNVFARFLPTERHPIPAVCVTEIRRRDFRRVTHGGHIARRVMGIMNEWASGGQRGWTVIKWKCIMIGIAADTSGYDMRGRPRRIVATCSVCAHSIETRARECHSAAAAFPRWKI